MRTASRRIRMGQAYMRSAHIWPLFFCIGKQFCVRKKKECMCMISLGLLPSTRLRVNQTRTIHGQVLLGLKQGLAGSVFRVVARMRFDSIGGYTLDLCGV